MATIYSATVQGVEARPVTVTAERMVAANAALPRGTLEIRGLPEAAVKDMRIRVKAALASTGPEIQLRDSWSVTIDPPAPTASGLDLPIAWALLRASGHEPDAHRTPVAWAFGELALSGDVRTARGIRAALATIPGSARAVIASGYDEQLVGLTVPVGPRLEGWRSLSDACGQRFSLVEPSPWSPVEHDRDARLPSTLTAWRPTLERVVFSAGHPALVLVAGPGGGAIVVARWIREQLDRAFPLDGYSGTDPHGVREEIARIASCAGLGAPTGRPFRAPHHTVSVAGLCGGGTPVVRPGEVTLAHGGVLLLDHALEFTRPAIAALVQALAAREVRVTRAGETVTMPARPICTIAVVDPCPCGWLGALSGSQCKCPPARVDAWRARIVELAGRLPGGPGGAPILDFTKPAPVSTQIGGAL